MDGIRKTSDELSQEIGEKDNHILAAQGNLNMAQEAQYQLKKQLIELTETVRQGKFNLSRLRVEKQILERQFWASR